MGKKTTSVLFIAFFLVLNSALAGYWNNSTSRALIFPSFPRDYTDSWQNSPRGIFAATFSQCDLYADISSTNVTCNGADDATITISNPSGGSGTYQYSINNGSSWQDSGSFSGLTNKTYQVLIRDKSSITCANFSECSP